MNSGKGVRCKDGNEEDGNDGRGVGGGGRGGRGGRETGGKTWRRKGVFGKYSIWHIILSLDITAKSISWQHENDTCEKNEQSNMCKNFWKYAGFEVLKF